MSRPSRPNRNLCVAIAGPSMAEAMEALARASEADMVELRLDLIENYDLEVLLMARPCPAVVTLRPRRQGGAYDGDEERRLTELRRAAALGAEWIDVELDAAAGLGPVPPSQRIVSYHDFTGLPDDVQGVLEELWRARCEAVKLAAMVERPSQLGPLLGLLSAAKGPSIGLGMGAAGVASRLLCLRSSACLLTYASLDPGRGTAPGQLTLDEMRRVYRAREIGSTTRAFGYLGLAEDRDLLWAANSELERAGLDGVFVPLGTTDAQAGLEAIGALQLQGAVAGPATEEGLSVLVPLTRDARRRKRVNTLLIQDGVLIGDWAPDMAAQVGLVAGLG